MAQQRHENARSAAGLTRRESVRRARRLFERAKDERFAVLAFNADNQDTVLAIARAAAATRAPVLVAVDHEEVTAIGLANLRSMVDGYNEELGTELYLNLDRSPSVAAAKAAIDAGFELVHLDLGDRRPGATDDEVLQATREVVRYARTTGAMVEGQPNHHGGTAVFDDAIEYAVVRKSFTTPQDAATFVAATGIDVLAAVLRDRPPKPSAQNVELELLEPIREAIDVTISLHGSSGTPGHLFTGAAQMGAGKINLHTELQHAYRATLELQLRMHLEEQAVVRLMPPVIAAVQRAAEDHIQSFGAAGRATP